jgi:WD40 repeat protein
MTHSPRDPSAEAAWSEIEPILDAELDALPDEARRLLIAHYLQEKSYSEIADELGMPRSSVARHVERARALLAARLARRGITVSAALLAVLLEESAKGAVVPAVLLVHTVEAARKFTEHTTGIMSDHVARLVKGGLANMAKGWTHWSMALAGWVSLLGAGLLACQTLEAWPDQKSQSEPPEALAAERPSQEKEKQARTDLHGDPLPPGALARLGTVRFRCYDSFAKSLVFTPDGKGLITAGGRNLPRLWDMATGKLIREFSNIPKPQKINGGIYVEISGATLSPNGRILAVRSGQLGSLYLLETATGKRLHEFKCEKGHLANGPYLNFAFSPDGKAIAAQLDGRLELRDVATGRPLWQKNEEEYISGLVFSPDGKTLASIGGDNRDGARLWDARTGELLRAVGSKKEMVISGNIAFSPDSRTLAMAYMPTKDSRYHSVYLWDVATGKEVRQLGEPGKSIAYPVFSPDGKVVAGMGDGAIRLWDTATGKELCRCQNSFDYGAYPVAFSPDGRVLAAQNRGPLVRFWEVASGKAMPSRLPPGHEKGVNSIAITPDGQTLISAGEDLTVRWWNTKTGQERFNLSYPKELSPLERGFSKVALSPDGTILAVIDGIHILDDKRHLANITEFLKGRHAGIWLWNAATGKKLRHLDDGNGVGIESLAFSPDGKVLAEGYGTAGAFGASFKGVRLWNVASGKRYKHELAGTCPVFSPDSSIIATVEDGPNKGIHFREVATGKKLRSIETDENIKCLALSPDGKTLATGSHKITLYPMYWDKQQSGVEFGASRLVSYPPHWAVTALSFSPDGRVLASGGDDHTIHLWETASGKERVRFQGHSPVDTSPGVLSLCFTADGQRLASGSADSTILIWDVTGRLQDGKLRLTKLSKKELEEQWADLAGNDVARAGRAIWTLVTAGPQAVSLLGERLKSAVAKESPEVVTRLIADLDAEDFKSRQKARQELAKLGEECEPALRQALAKQPSVEMRHRLQELLSKLEEERKEPSGELLRGVRAVEVLEQVGTPDARRILEVWSRDALGVLKREAQAALGRLDRKQPR